MIAAEDCAFCRIVAGTNPARVVWRSPAALAFFPVAPATIGHTLVVPANHYRDLFEIDTETMQSLAELVLIVAKAAKAVFRPEGLNLIQSNGQIATQTVPHVHFHVLPRWKGDGVSDPWPEEREWAPKELDVAADKLRKKLEGGQIDGSAV